MLVGLAAFYAAPPAILGPPAYPYSDFVQVLLPLAVSAIICITAQQLVARARRDAAEARRQRAMIEQVGAVVHNLFTSADVRSDLCAATLRVAGASAAILLEPEPVRRDRPRHRRGGRRPQHARHDDAVREHARATCWPTAAGGCSAGSIPSA